MRDGAAPPPEDLYPIRLPGTPRRLRVGFARSRTTVAYLLLEWLASDADSCNCRQIGPD
jgi:hypothetical protein